MNDKHLLRVAERIQQSLQQLQLRYYLECVRRLTLLSNAMTETRGQSRKLELALARKWLAASKTCCIRVQRTLGEIPHHVTRVQDILRKRQPQVPKLSALFAELKAVEAEFGGIQYQTDERAVSVITESITLEGIYLGPFRIALFWDLVPELFSRHVYAVYAADPNPATTDNSVTHPHINGDTLCEGEGHAAIQAALETGRLLDFFTMIRSILTTYNPDSAYVRLEDWEGVPCYECGYCMHADQIYYCDSCQNEYCDECSTCCEQCHEIICLGCAVHCALCKEPLCHRCQRTCRQCHLVVCESCLENGICDDCRETMENDYEQEHKETSKEPQPLQVRLVG